MLSTPLHSTPLIICLLILAFGIAPSQSRATLSVKGKWTWVAKSQWDSTKTEGPNQLGLQWPGSGGATHMALLRGNADSSWVMHWNTGSSGRLWLAEPLDDSTAAHKVPIDIENELNTFCAGQAVLPDGRLMVVGGTVVGVTGETRAPVFDPKNYSNATHGWTVTADTTAPDTVEYGRWYPTVTALGDGTMLTTSGYDYLNMQLFGGTRDSSGTTVLMNEFRLLNLRTWLRWEDDRPELTNRPSPRSGHSAVFYYSRGRTVLFGGLRDSAGLKIPTNEVRQMFVYNNTQEGHNWLWESPTVVGDSANGAAFPLPRHRHAAVIVDNVMVIYGGIGRTATGQDTVLSDVWRLILDPTNVKHRWKRDIESGGPGARYGHTAVIDGDEDGGPTPAMLIYGGRSVVDGTFAGEKAWQLTLDRDDEVTPIAWTEIADTGPGKREGHVAVMDTVDQHTNNPILHRMVVFGGVQDTVGGAKLKRDVWFLSRPEPMGAGAWSWSQFTPDSTPPTARTRAMGIYDVEWQRLLMFGGDTTLTTGGETADLWGLRLDIGGASWERLWQHAAPEARQGAVVIFDPRAVPSKEPERYDPNQAPGDKWSALDDGAKWLDNYPFMFQLQNGKVFYAGNGTSINNDSSYVFDLATESWSNAKKSEFVGGSAVLTYAADGTETVMKCGAPDHHNTAPMSIRTRTAVVDANGSTSWASQVNLPTDRRFHNLTIVPDGRVLMTGGWKQDLPRTYARTPFFYHAGSWGPTDESKYLANDLTGRSYHSTALLLPDGRILAAGGPPTDDTLTATAFWPPYLWKNDTLATRPTLTSYPNYTKHYKEPFYVDFNLGDGSPIDSITILSLIRPGAVTHGFDQNQRYLSLPFTKTHGFLRAVLDSNSNKIPPGDYLLFGVRTPGVGGVPSVGKWMRIESETDVTPPATSEMLMESKTPSSITLTWSAPGDDSLHATAKTYDLRYRTDVAVTEANFDASTQAPTLAPRPSGDQESVTVSPLQSCTVYYFGLKTLDEATNKSSLESFAMSTGCPGGSGCDPHCQEEASARPAEGYVMTHTEVMRLGVRVGATGITLAHAGATAFRLDSLEVIEITPGADSMAVLNGGGIRLGSPVQAVSIESSAGDVIQVVTTSGYVAAPGETLVVRFAGSDSSGSGSAMVLKTQTTGAEEGGIRVYRERGDGTWKAIDLVAPRPGDDLSVTGNVEADHVRLVFDGSHRIMGVSHVMPSSATRASRVVELKSAVHSRIGDVAIPAGDAGVVLEPMDLLQVELADTNAVSDSRERLLRYRVSAATGAPVRQRRTGTASLPTEFALGQNQPNPFGEGTVIRFALPVKAMVTLEVFDVHGRRMRTLTRDQWQAGYHSLACDGRDSAGRRVSAGIYLYRLAAGPYHASRKLVVLP